MYPQQQYDALRPFSLPEIRRVALEAVVLQIKALAGSAMDPRAFGFIDPPEPDALEAAVLNLKQVGGRSGLAGAWCLAWWRLAKMWPWAWLQWPGWLVVGKMWPGAWFRGAWRDLHAASEGRQGRAAAVARG
jgi:hypothetical protein